MKFVLIIELGNAGMTNSQQVAEALRKTADKVQHARVRSHEGGKIMDVNGNSVGEWDFR